MLADRQRYASKFTEPELRLLRQQSDAADVNLQGIMAVLSEHVAKTEEQAAVVAQPTQEQPLAGMDAVEAQLFRIALQLGLSVQTFRELLREADRQSLDWDWDSLLSDALAAKQRAMREPQPPPPTRGRDRKSGRSIPVTVKPRKRRAAA